MVVDRSRRRCLLCDRHFRGRTFLCRPCADTYRDAPVPDDVRMRFYQRVDEVYPDWSNTYGHYNPPVGLLRRVDSLPRDVRIIEIGAGGGFTLAHLRERGFRNLIGLDLTPSTMAAMRARLPDVPLITADAELLPVRDRSVDVLLSSDVIEHLPGLERHIAEAARVLRPGGIYLIKTPNRLLADLYYRLRGLYDAYFWHPSMCSPGELRAVLERHGFACAFLNVPRLTQAQLRKIPLAAARPVAARLPLDWLPPVGRPHLEVVATRR